MKQMLTMTINGSEVDCQQGKTVHEVCADKGIPTPTMCHDARLKPYGALSSLSGRGSRCCQTPYLLHHSGGKWYAGYYGKSAADQTAQDHH